uniref:Uncharacterized protein n=1 Tax=Amphiprion ocellaris TaxID=80972 RepID=A0AAQ5Y7P9_AMPOC
MIFHLFSVNFHSFFFFFFFLTISGPPVPNNRPLPQWGVGLIAVSGFLFLSFVVLLVKKAWTRNGVESVRGNDFVMSNTFKTDVGDNR